MTVIWLAILILYGLIAGWSHINTLAWLLLVPMVIQDIYDVNRKRS